MVFNSFQFLIFFPIVACIYFFCSYKIRKNIVSQIFLLVTSLFFYACWNPKYLLLILTSVVITYFSGILMQDFRKQRTLVLVFSLLSNLAILFFFKYYNFFADSLNSLFSFVQYKRTIPHFDVILPVGISFYTFQALGYSIDAYTGKIKAERNFITYALFVTFFPQLVAGPIERTGNLLPQFKADYKIDYDRITSGLKLAAWGYFQKVVVADLLAIYVNGIFNNLEVSTGASVALATFFFCFQVLCDFAGYSNIAIGVAKILGFNLMRNFRSPFLSKSIPELWTRWHISLSTWFKDYIYIPLGGSRCSQFRHCFNLFVIFIVSGIWHGAAWHYVFWGLLHAVFQIIDVLTRKIRGKALLACGLATLDSSGKRIMAKRGWQYVQVLITFFLFWFAAIFFRANNMSDAFFAVKKILFLPSEFFGFLSNLSNLGIVSSVREVFLFSESVSGFGLRRAIFAFVLVAVLLTVDILTRTATGTELIMRKPKAVRWICYYLIVYVILFLQVSEKTDFVYFQF